MVHKTETQTNYPSCVIVWINPETNEESRYEGILIAPNTALFRDHSVPGMVELTKVTPLAAPDTYLYTDAHFFAWSGSLTDFAVYLQRASTFEYLSHLLAIVEDIPTLKAAPPVAI
jgi:hypothetical protein